MSKPGRPPLDPAGAKAAPVHLKLTAEDYARIDALAKQQRKSIQDVIRSGLRHLLTSERGGRL